jgi:hypothetical protein
MRRRREATAPLRRGDLVTLRSPREILATLDESGSLEGVPFMPEMLAYFGRQFQVTARVERACDTITKTGARRMVNTVVIDDIRCDGGGHGGCQAGCRVYWKEAWLRRAENGANDVPPEQGGALDHLRRLATENATTASPDVPDGEHVYRCQATEFLRSTTPLGYWDLRSFLRELTSRNVSLWTFVKVLGRIVVNEPRRRWGRRTPLRYSGAAPSRGTGHGFHPGSKVRVRSAEEIGQTLDERSKLRGLWFDREMIPYCGTSAAVKAKVERFVNEESGAMVELKSDCYILNGVVCKGYISDGRWFCCRAIYPWWREAWLEPVTDETP